VSVSDTKSKKGRTHSRENHNILRIYFTVITIQIKSIILLFSAFLFSLTDLYWCEHASQVDFRWVFAGAKVCFDKNISHVCDRIFRLVSRYCTIQVNSGAQIVPGQSRCMYHLHNKNMTSTEVEIKATDMSETLL
jgi:hypothetical protein